MELISVGFGMFLKIFDKQYNSLYLQLFEPDDMPSTMRFSSQYISFLKSNLYLSKGSQTHCSLASQELSHFLMTVGLL